MGSRRNRNRGEADVALADISNVIGEVAMHQPAGSHGVCVARMNRAAGAKPMEALRVIADLPRATPKITIVGRVEKAAQPGTRVPVLLGETQLLHQLPVVLVIARDVLGHFLAVSMHE